MPPETVLQIKTFHILRKNWPKSQTKTKKTQNMILARRFGDPQQEICAVPGRLSPLRNEFPEFWEFLGIPVYSKTCK